MSTLGGRKMDAKDKADAFVEELRGLVKKHYGSLAENEVEPIGMHLRQLLPTLDASSAADVTTTATVTLYPSLDTDPPDSD